MNKTIVIFNIASYLQVPGGAQESIEGLLKCLSSKNVRTIYITFSFRNREFVESTSYYFLILYDYS